MAKRIEKLVLESFRGATCRVELEFDPNKPTVLIFGENGTGKSTIVDALDFVFNRSMGSLESRSIGHSRAQHVPSLGSHARGVKVSAVCGGDTWEAKLDGREPSVTGPESHASVRILRRSQILDVINAPPRERYEAIQDFIQVPCVQRCEDNLRQTCKDAEDALKAARGAQAQAVEALEKYWKAEGAAGQDALSWAAEESRKDDRALKTTVDCLTAVLRAIGQAITAGTALSTAEAEHCAAEEARKKAQDALDAAIAEPGGAGASSSLIDVLEDVQRWLKECPGAKSCPVCEQAIEGHQLEDKVLQRLGAMHRLIDLKRQLDGAKRETANKIAVVTRHRSLLLAAMHELGHATANTPVQEFTRLGIDLSPFLQTAQTNAEPIGHIVELAQNALQLIECAHAALQVNCDASHKSVYQLNAIRAHFTTIQEKAASTVALDRLLKRLSGILEVAEKQRKQYAEGVLGSVSTAVEAMYLKVHPNERIGGVRFFLNPQFQHSLEFDGNFEHVTGIQPGAYYSESHLDTLGVCVFLALAKRLGSNDTIAVLDDVVTSIDQAHMERFINLLHDEAQDFEQLIITTHYRPWRDRYRYARGPAASTQLIELLHWSLPRGIRHTKTKLRVEELEEYLSQEPMDRQIVSSKAGILLESLLDHIALLYECRIARKPEPFYTLGELTDCIGRRLRRALKSQFVAEDQANILSEVPLDPVLTRIGGLASWIRNQVGCHWNLSGLDVSDADVTDFGQITIDLANALVCNACGGLALRDRSGSYFECACGRTRLHPHDNPD